MYYNLKRMPDGYRMVKFDSLYNVEAVYNIRFSRGRFYCDCPAGNQPECRHREMVHIFLDNKAADTGKFFCYDSGDWHPAIEGVDDELQIQEFKRARKSLRPTRKNSRRYSGG